MFTRHSLAWLSDDGWQNAIKAAAESDRHPISEWRYADWPAIVRRYDADTKAGHICLGLALPPDPVSGYKPRIALDIVCAHVKKILPPLKLKAVLHTVGPDWATDLARLQADADAAALPLRVYGSCTWQALTGQQYLTPASDIDVLLYPGTARQLRDGIQLLELHAKRLPLDGEIIFPSGQAVAWKEWRNAAQQKTARVLVKEMRKISLSTMQAMLATFEER